MTKLEERVINRYIPIPYLMEKYTDKRGNYQSKCFCPMHDNENTPAAKIYHDEDGDKLWCFAENRMYFPSDFFKKGIVTVDSSVVFNNIWSKLTEEEKSKLLTEEDIKIELNLDEEDCKKFKQGSISLYSFTKSIIKSINKSYKERSNENLGSVTKGNK